MGYFTKYKDNFLIFENIYRGFILNNLYIETFKFILLRKLKKLKNTS